jgi:hypothetical protein
MQVLSDLFRIYGKECDEIRGLEGSNFGIAETL